MGKILLFCSLVLAGISVPCFGNPPPIAMSCDEAYERTGGIASQRHFLSLQEKVEWSAGIADIQERLADFDRLGGGRWGNSKRQLKRTLSKLQADLERGYIELNESTAMLSPRIADIVRPPRLPALWQEDLKEVSLVAYAHEPTVARWEWLKDRGWMVALVDSSEISGGALHHVSVPRREVRVAESHPDKDAEYDVDAEVVGAIARAFFYTRVLLPTKPDYFSQDFTTRVSTALGATMAGDEAMAGAIKRISGTELKLEELPPAVRQKVMSDLVAEAAAVYSDEAVAEAKRTFMRDIRRAPGFHDYRTPDSEMVSRYGMDPALVQAIRYDRSLSRDWVTPE